VAGEALQFRSAAEVTFHTKMKSRPGFPHKDISWLVGLIAIRAPLSTIRRLSSSTPKARTRDTTGFQLADSKFTLLGWQKCEPDFAKQISKKLKTMVVYLWDEDTSGWFGYSVFENGAEVEAFQYGANYEDELGEFAEELGEALPTPAKRKKGWDLFVSKDGEDFQFRSKLVKVTEKELRKRLQFVDARFNKLGVPIPRDFPKEQEAFSFPQNEGGSKARPTFPAVAWPCTPRILPRFLS
jgi:hypothetical protein